MKPTIDVLQAMRTRKEGNHVSPDGKWETMARPTGLLRYTPSGTFFARVRYKGILLGPRTLETVEYRTAVDRMPIYVQKWKDEHDDACETRKPKKEPTTWGDAGEEFRQESENLFKLGSIQSLALRTRIRYLNKIAYFWPSLTDTPVRDISASEALTFMAEAKSGTGRFIRRARPDGVTISRKNLFLGGPECPSAFGTLLWVARSVANKAIEGDKRKGLPECDNPFDSVPHMRVLPALPPLPSEDQFALILKEVRDRSCQMTTDESRFRAWAGINFLSMSGLRITELVGESKPKHEGEIPHPGLLWEDIRHDLDEPYIHATCEKKRKNENWRRRRIVPFFGGADGEMAELVKEMRTRWYKGNPKASVFENVARSKGFNSYLQRACHNLGLTTGDGKPLHLTQHDLRHVFATRCVEANVTWKALAEWLGHEDGGLLAAKTYCHLRDERAFEMASRLTKGS